MEKAKRVKIVEVCKVTPSSNYSANFSLPLSSSDWMFLKFLPTERLFFYQLTESESDPPFLDSIILKLKHSLSLTLQHFLPLAGNLVWPNYSPKPFFLYTPNDGVSFTVAEIDSDFNLLSSNHPHEVQESRCLVPTIQYSDTNVAVMAVQVTKFAANDGFSIGLSCLHVLLDGKSVSLFMKAWAHICNQLELYSSSSSSFLLPDELTPSFERGNLVLENPSDFIDPNEKSLKVKSSHDIDSDSNLFHGTFELTRAHIEKLKKRVLEKCLTKEEFHLSSFVIAFAHSLVCLVKAKQDESEENFFVVLTADARPLMDPPVSSNYFGNCLRFVFGLAERKEFTEKEEEGFPNTAKKISDLIMDLKTSTSVIVPNKASQSQQNSSPSGFELCSVASSPKFKLYETDFGWGKPKKITFVSLGKNNISISETRDGDGGIEVGIILPYYQMNSFSSLFSKGLN